MLEFERTKEIIARRLPPAPARVADVGGGSGRYARWLADAGYTVALRDLVPLHVEQARARTQGQPVECRVGDAWKLDLADHSVDAVLLLGPLYHLADRGDRLAALGEARRVTRPGGWLFAAAISRWAARIDGVTVAAAYRALPNLRREVAAMESHGWMAPLIPGSFCGFAHRPRQLRLEATAAG